jgi:V/A-type H+-transporting ATPase subunit K
MGVVGLIVAVVQGKAIVSGIMLIGKRPGELAKAIVYVAMIETFAIFALLVSFLMYNSVAL